MLERILRALGYELDLAPHIIFRELQLADPGRTFHVPDRLWRLNTADCFAPLTARPSGMNPYDLTERAERAAAYIWLLEHGSPEQLLAHLDGALLVDAWPQLAASLHTDVRQAWAPLIDSTLDDWLIARLRDQEARRLRKPLSRQARGRAIRRMFEYGLTQDQVRAALRPDPKK